MTMSGLHCSKALGKLLPKKHVNSYNANDIPKELHHSSLDSIDGFKVLVCNYMLLYTQLYICKQASWMTYELVEWKMS